MGISARFWMRVIQAVQGSVLAVLLILFCLATCDKAQAQVGPAEPPPKQSSQMNKALARLLKKDKETNTDNNENGDSRTDSTDPGDTSAVDDGKSDPDAKPFYPSNGPGPSNQLPPTKHKAKKKPARKSSSNASGTGATVNAFGQPSSATPMGGEETAPERPPLLTQPPLTNANVDTPQIDTANPPILTHPKLDDPRNPLGFRDSENKLKRYIDLVSAHRYAEARSGVMALKQFLIDLTEAHIGLYKTLSQIPSARGQAELEKELALQFAQLRDRAIVEAARIHIADKDYFHAVKELTEVVKSQPRTRLGVHSYELLQEMGFTEKLQLTQE
jgi:hypothetical protein